MKKLSDYKDYTGIDASIETSLFEYGLIWKKIDNEEYKFIYGVDIDDKGFRNKFDYAYLSKKDFIDIFNDWGNKSDIESFTGKKFDTWIESFPYCVCDIMVYYGCYNVFGSSYNLFEIINDSKIRSNTMNCTIKINMDNDSFSKNPEYELSRILRALAHRIEHGPLQYIPNEETYLKSSVQSLFDINGNKVGECIIE